jgi:hypothetical protein
MSDTTKFNKTKKILGLPEPEENNQPSERSNFDFSPSNIYNNLGKILDPVGTENRERSAKIESLKNSVYDQNTPPMNRQFNQEELNRLTPEQLQEYMKNYPQGQG